MLYTFHKYTNAVKNTLLISIKAKKNEKSTHFNRSIRLKYSQINTYHVYLSTFFRRAYFRTLITYINLLYATLCTPSDSNVFYYVHFMYIYYIGTHPSFYFKKIIII